MQACNFGCCDRQTRVAGECWCLSCQAWHYQLCWTHGCIMLTRWGRGGCPLFAMHYLDLGDCKVGDFGQRPAVSTKQQPMWQPSSVLQHLPAAEQLSGCMPHTLLHARILMLVSRCRAIKLSGSDETVSHSHHLPHTLCPVAGACLCWDTRWFQQIEVIKQQDHQLKWLSRSSLYILLRDDRADSNST